MEDIKGVYVHHIAFFNGVLETMLWSLLKFLLNILALVCVTKFINVRLIISKPSILSIKILLTY